MVAIGASTGGPEAVAAFLEGFGAGTVPCVVAQHMPVGLAAELAASLTRRLHRPVGVAEDGTLLCPGHVLMLPGGSDGDQYRPQGFLVGEVGPTHAQGVAVEQQREWEEKMVATATKRAGCPFAM